MKKDNSLFYLFQRWGINDKFPMIASHLAMEDIIIPDQSRTLAFIDAIQAIELEKKKCKQPDELFPDLPARTFLQKINPLCWLADGARRSVLEMEYTPVPDYFIGRYGSLTNIERAIAFNSFSTGAEVLEPGDSLYNLSAQLSEDSGIPLPRIIRINSDFPMAVALTLPDRQSAIIVSDVVERVMPERCLRAIIAHEFCHIRDHAGESWVGMGLRGFGNNMTHNLRAYLNEYRADALAKKLVGQPEHLVDGMMAVTECQKKLQHFVREVNGLLAQYDVRFSALPPMFASMLSNISSSKVRIFQEKTGKALMRANGEDPHPPQVLRFDALYRDDDAGNRSR